MSAGWQIQASWKAPTAINCPCNNNPGSPTGSSIANKTAKALKGKLDKLATMKCQLGLANQVRLAELELVDLRRNGTPRNSPTIDNLPRHTRARTISDVNEWLLHKRPRPIKSYQKALEPPHYKNKAHQEYLKFNCACDQVFNTQPDVYCNNSLKVIYAQGYLFKNVQNTWYQRQNDQDLDGTTWKNFGDLLLKHLRPVSMRNIDIEKCYLEARQGLSQTVNSFTAYLDQLESQFLLPVLEPQQAKNLLHKLWPKISRKIF